MANTTIEVDGVRYGVEQASDGTYNLNTFHETNTDFRPASLVGKQLKSWIDAQLKGWAAGRDRTGAFRKGDGRTWMVCRDLMEAWIRQCNERNRAGAEQTTNVDTPEDSYLARLIQRALDAVTGLFGTRLSDVERDLKAADTRLTDVANGLKAISSTIVRLSKDVVNLEFDRDEQARAIEGLGAADQALRATQSVQAVQMTTWETTVATYATEMVAHRQTIDQLTATMTGLSKQISILLQTIETQEQRIKALEERGHGEDDQGSSWNWFPRKPRR